MTLHAGRADSVGLNSMKCVPVLALMLAALPAFGGELVVFSSGLKLRADRHEQEGTQIRLFHNGGVIEVPATLVAGFEQEEIVAVAPAPPIAEVPEAKIPAPQSPKEMLREAALRSGLPPEFVQSVALVESGMRSDAISPKGAIGVMQLMPGTAKIMGADPHDTVQNIDAGTRLLRELLVKYNGDVVKALAAYNAGEGAVDRYQGVPPYNETRWYVKKVIDAYQKAGGQ